MAWSIVQWALLAAAAVAALYAVSWVMGPKKANLRGRHVLITGGSSGIGKAVAAEALKQGAKVTLVARTLANLQAAHKELLPLAASGSFVHIESCDVTSNEASQAMFDKVVKETGAVDFLVCSAGTSSPYRFEDMPAEEFDMVLKLNVNGCANVCRAAVPHMKRRRTGAIVLVSSQAGQVGLFGYSAYSASKFALRGFAEALAMECKPYNVSVCLSFPPDTQTPLLDRENLTKPIETKLISASSATFTAEAVAKTIVEGMKVGTFFIPVGFDGAMLALATGGMSPAATLWEGFLQVCAAGIMRGVALGMLWSWNSLVAKQARIRDKTK